LTQGIDHEVLLFIMIDHDQQRQARANDEHPPPLHQMWPQQVRRARCEPLAASVAMLWDLPTSMAVMPLAQQGLCPQLCLGALRPRGIKLALLLASPKAKKASAPVSGLCFLPSLTSQSQTHQNACRRLHYSHT
jgi:hypothetical protein